MAVTRVIGRKMRRRVESCMFFFSSRRRHTRFDCDWSSDVCSSDLHGHVLAMCDWCNLHYGRHGSKPDRVELAHDKDLGRSEERRVGKECRSRWSPDHQKKKREMLRTPVSMTIPHVRSLTPLNGRQL